MPAAQQKSGAARSDEGYWLGKHMELRVKLQDLREDHAMLQEKHARLQKRYDVLRRRTRGEK